MARSVRKHSKKSEPVSPMVPIVPHPAYRAEDHYVLQDDNDVAGCFICVPIEGLERKAREKDLVHLEQRCGKLVCTAVRKVELRGRSMQFVSLSRAALEGGLRWPMRLRAKDVTIKGVVAGRYTRYST